MTTIARNGGGGGRLENIPIISPEELFTLCKEKPQEYTIVITCAVLGKLQILVQLMLAGLGENIPIYSAVQIEACLYQDKFNLVLNILEDRKSKFIYQEMIKNMCHGCHTNLLLAENDKYFGNDIISNLQEEVMIDAGVCEGEEIDKALKMCDNCMIYAFEPHKESKKKLDKKHQNDSRVKVSDFALSDKRGNAYFNTNINAPAGSSVVSYTDDTQSNQVNMISIDEFIEEEKIEKKITFIKMDIEGAEYQALLGAKKTIQKDSPKLAICVYHSVEDYVRIPLLIKEMNSNYKFYFRQHSGMRMESVLYALPIN